MTRPVVGTRLPSPYMVPFTRALARDQNTLVYGNSAWPANNRALYLPFSLPVTVEATAMSMYATTASGTWDIGLYDSNCATLLASQGSATVASGMNTWTMPTTMLLEAGVRYFAALVLSTTGCQIIRINPSAQGCRIGGYAQEALVSSVLPSTATPAQTATAYLPVLALTLNI